MKKVLFWIFTIIILLLITVNMLTAIFNVSLFGYRIYRIGSGSMDPYLEVNDVILIKSQNDYKVDDIITYKSNDNEYITHRIVEIDGDKIITKGDANNTEDKPIKKNNIIGKLVFKFVGFSFISYLFNKSIFWVLLFIVGLIITMIIPDKKKS